MGLMKDTANGEEPDQENDPEKLEGEYERMYMKIGRDFVHREDLAAILNEFKTKLLQALPTTAVTLSTINVRRKSNALAQAAIYKEYVENEKDGVKDFAEPFDLAKIEEDED